MALTPPGLVGPSDTGGGKTRCERHRIVCAQFPQRPECSQGLYPYVLDRDANLTVLVLTVLLTFVTFLLLIPRRTRTYTAALLFGFLAQVAGYLARYQSTCDGQLDRDHFYVQITTLAVAPGFFAAAIYWSSRNVVGFFGERHSVLRRQYYNAVRLSRTKRKNGFFLWCGHHC